MHHCCLGLSRHVGLSAPRRHSQVPEVRTAGRSKLGRRRTISEEVRGRSEGGLSVSIQAVLMARVAPMRGKEVSPCSGGE